VFISLKWLFVPANVKPARLTVRKMCPSCTRSAGAVTGWLTVGSMRFMSQSVFIKTFIRSGFAAALTNFTSTAEEEMVTMWKTGSAPKKRSSGREPGASRRKQLEESGTSVQLAVGAWLHGAKARSAS
jgi:hypothetical protein